MADSRFERAALRENSQLKARARAERDERIRRMLARGWTVAEVARATGIDYGAVRRASADRAPTDRRPPTETAAQGVL